MLKRENNKRVQSNQRNDQRRTKAANPVEKRSISESSPKAHVREPTRYQKFLRKKRNFGAPANWYAEILRCRPTHRNCERKRWKRNSPNSVVLPKDNGLERLETWRWILKTVTRMWEREDCTAPQWSELRDGRSYSDELENEACRRVATVQLPTDESCATAGSYSDKRETEAWRKVVAILLFRLFTLD